MKTPSTCLALTLVFLAWAFPSSGAESALKWSGELDVRWSTFSARQSSPFYRLNFYGQDLPGSLTQSKLELYLNADYKHDKMGVNLKTRSDYYSDAYSVLELLEAYGGIDLSANTNMQAGKIIYNWGKGYAFNPAARINPPKNPELPDRQEPGLMSLKINRIMGFDDSLIQVFTPTLVFVLPEADINNIYSKSNKNVVFKTYLLVADTDLDFMLYTTAEAPVSFGFDFSRNLKENLEIHAESYLFNDQAKYTINNNNLTPSLVSGNSYLLGFRYLNALNTTIIGEYYHNASGLTKDEYLNYTSFIEEQVNSGSSEAVKRALLYSQTYFKGANLMKDYLYLKITQPEPFNLLYFTPSVFFLFNLNDGSAIVSAPLSFERAENMEFLIQPTLLTGASRTEYGDKQFQSKIEVWLKFYF